MPAQHQLELRAALEREGVIFFYCGYMTEEILSGVGRALKRKLALEQTDAKTIRAVFSIFVEQVQNVIRYSAEQEPPDDAEDNALSFGQLTIGRAADAIFLTCANKIRQEHVDQLNGKLTNLRQMDRGDLKALYKETLKGEVPEGSKGAGVGFIDIARRTSRPIEFDFVDVDDRHAFFCLTAHI